MSNDKAPKRIMDSGFSDWSPSQLPNLIGKTYVITGGNSGIGFEAAKMLAESGASLVIAARNAGKGMKAVDALKGQFGGKIEFVQLDLSDLSSVRKAVAEVKGRYDKIDGLINNAGIMQTPEMVTRDGFELQLGTNHLGHFLWAGLLFDLVLAAKGRIVTVASIAHKFGKMHFDDLMLKKSYSPSKAYGQSKLANLLFALELDRKLKAAGSDVQSIACHPGYSATNLQSTGPTGFLNFIYKASNALMAQPARNGAIPTVLAAAGDEAKAGGYYGPQAMGETRGRISDGLLTIRARSENSAKRLWEISEDLVGFHWNIG